MNAALLKLDIQRSKRGVRVYARLVINKPLLLKFACNARPKETAAVCLQLNPSSSNISSVKASRALSSFVRNFKNSFNWTTFHASAKCRRKIKTFVNVKLWESQNTAAWCEKCHRLPSVSWTWTSALGGGGSLQTEELTQRFICQAFVSVVSRVHRLSVSVAAVKSRISGLDDRKSSVSYIPWGVNCTKNEEFNATTAQVEQRSVPLTLGRRIAFWYKKAANCHKYPAEHDGRRRP